MKVLCGLWENIPREKENKIVPESLEKQRRTLKSTTIPFQRSNETHPNILLMFLFSQIHKFFLNRGRYLCTSWKLLIVSEIKVNQEHVNTFHQLFYCKFILVELCGWLCLSKLGARNSKVGWVKKLGQLVIIYVLSST